MPADAPRTTAARLAQGLLSGLTATGVMSVAFGIGQVAGAIDRLPPRLIVDRIFPALPVPARASLEWLLHFGYGAAGGSAYSMAARPAKRGPLTGSLFGLAVWAAGYEGWVPALGVLPPAHRDRRARAVTILLAHLVYGAALGGVGHRLHGSAAAR